MLYPEEAHAFWCQPGFPPCPLLALQKDVTILTQRQLKAVRGRLPLEVEQVWLDPVAEVWGHVHLLNSWCRGVGAWNSFTQVLDCLGVDVVEGDGDAREHLVNVFMSVTHREE